MSTSHGLVRVPNPFMNMLISTNVGDVRTPRPVSFLRAADTMHDVLTAQHTNTVQSFPVLDEYGECLGIIDGVDLTTFLRSNSSDPQRALKNTIESFLNSFQTAYYIPVFSTTSQYAVITILAPGCHRTVVFTNENDMTIYSMFSESDLVQFLFYLLSHDSDNKPMQRVADQPVCCFSGSRSRPTHTAFGDEKQENAFSQVLSFRMGRTASATVSCEVGESFDYRTPLVAVFDRTTGALIGHVDSKTLGQTCGGTDCKSVSLEEGVHNMQNPIDLTLKEYIDKFSPESSHTWIVPENITLRGLLEVIVKNKLHHVWVGDRNIQPQPLHEIAKHIANPNQNEPIDEDVLRLYTRGILGVVTLNDVLRWVARDNLWLKMNELPPE